MTIDDFSRRRLLTGGAGVALGTLAGCLDELDADAAGSSEPRVAASFFVVGEFAKRVAGDEAAVDTLVPVGQHGHGWEPSASIQRDARKADLFVRVGEGFQPWADDLVEGIDADGADVADVSANADVTLRQPGESHEEGEHDGHDEDGHEEDEKHDGHDEDEHEEDEKHDGHDEKEEGHDHGSHDPHFWLDPTRAATAAETVADAVGGLDGVDADRVDENAGEFVAELEALDEEFAEALAGGTRDVVLVAGHDAYGYLGARYGFEVHTLTGLAPDDEPSPADRREAQEAVERHGIEHVLTPVFESDRAATELVRETDATGTLPITPIPGQAEEWREEGWGYLDVMREVNLPSLREALDA